MTKFVIQLEMSCDQEQAANSLDCGGETPLPLDEMVGRIVAFLHSESGLDDKLWFPGIEVENIKRFTEGGNLASAH